MKKEIIYIKPGDEITIENKYYWLGDMFFDGGEILKRYSPKSPHSQNLIKPPADDSQKD